MPKFIQLSNKERVKLFRQVKEKINTTWDLFYSHLGVSRTMFFNYLSGKYDLPEKIFFKLEKIAGIKIENSKEIHKTKSLRKEIKNIRMNSSLAEVFGILNGDGHISKINQEICVVGSILEREYFDYMKNLFENNFGLNFKIQPQKTKLKLRAYSKRLVKILSEDYELPKGNKLGQLKIPELVYSKEKWLRSYIRGLFDTDGSVYLRRKSDIVVNICSADKRFLSQIQNALESLGFGPVVSGKDLYLYRKNEVEKFFQIIKPANPKHLKRYDLFKK